MTQDTSYEFYKCNKEKHKHICPDCKILSDEIPSLHFLKEIGFGLTSNLVWDLAIHRPRGHKTASNSVPQRQRETIAIGSSGFHAEDPKLSYEGKMACYEEIKKQRSRTNSQVSGLIQVRPPVQLF